MSSTRPLAGTETPPASNDEAKEKEPVIDTPEGERPASSAEAKQASQPAPLPVEARKKLQRLEKLEPKYQGE
ncbi:MAG: hypothetical protein INR71_01340 [Terriglobus roseus]|nr:hypothetical protein [Terriglobus roseus]